MVNYMKVATCVCKIISFVEIRHFVTEYLCKSNTEIAAFVDNNKKEAAKFVSLFALLYIYIYAKM